MWVKNKRTEATERRRTERDENICRPRFSKLEPAHRCHLPRLTAVTLAVSVMIHWLI